MNSTDYADYRCACGKLLCKGFIRDGEIEIKCKRCGAMKRITPPLTKDRPSKAKGK